MSSLPMCSDSSTAPGSSRLSRRRINVATAITSGSFERQWSTESSYRESPLNKSYRDGSSSSPRFSAAKLWAAVVVIISILPWVQYSIVKKRLVAAKDEIALLRARETQTAIDLRKKGDEVKTLETLSRSVKQFNTILLSDLRQSGLLVDTDSKSYEEMEQLEDALISNIDHLETYIQRWSRIAVEEKYGYGPYRVEISLKPKNEDSQVFSRGAKAAFTLEMAPLSKMPHSVHHFLRMVSAELWDGLTMVHKERDSHIIQGTPVRAANAEPADARFREAHLTKLAFSEYSDDFPHLPYTIGFSGKPGGPGFYINSKDNSALHGPSGLDYDDGEPCFGTVVSGREVLDQIIQSEENGEFNRVFEIESARLLPSEVA